MEVHSSYIQQRELFSDYGCHENVDIQSNNKVTPQKQISGFIGDLETLKARRPTLPLCIAMDNHGNHNQMMVDINSQIESARALKACIQHLRFQKTNLKEEDKSLVRNIWNGLNLRVDGQYTTKSVLKPELLKELVKNYQGCHYITEFKKNNSLYAGGCVSWLPSCQKSGRLFSVTGEGFSSINITDVSHDDNLILHPVATASININYALYELSAQRLRGTDHVAVRGRSSCELLSDRNTDELDCFTLTSTDKMTLSEDEHPTSLCLSPYIPGECLVTSDKGNAVLWTAGVGREEVLCEKPARFDVSDSWTQAWFGGHPRQLVYADLTAVELFDMRSGDSRGVELFGLSSKFLHPLERVRVGKQHPVSPFCHVVATDFSLFLMDQRFPSHPMLQWQHMLRNPPQYISVQKEEVKGHSLILLASQSPPDACCFLFDSTSGNVLQALDAPWGLSRIDDFTKYLSTGANSLMMKDWFDKISLAGITVLPHNRGFTGVQMDSSGEIFYQSFEWTNQSGDKTYSYGPGSCDIILDQLSVDIGKKWMENLKNKHKKADQRRIEKQLNVKFKDITFMNEPNIHCPLCRGPDKDNTFDHAAANTCPACLQTLDRSHHLATDDMDCVMPCEGSSHGNWRDLSDPFDMPKEDALSQILMKLWHEEEPDLSDLLKMRNKEIAKKRKDRRDSKAERKLYSEPNNDVDIFQFFTGIADAECSQSDTNFHQELDTNKSGFFGQVKTRGLCMEHNQDRGPILNVGSPNTCLESPKIHSNLSNQLSATTAMDSTSPLIHDGSGENSETLGSKRKLHFESPTIFNTPGCFSLETRPVHSGASPEILNSPFKKHCLDSRSDCFSRSKSSNLLARSDAKTVKLNCENNEASTSISHSETYDMHNDNVHSYHDLNRVESGSHLQEDHIMQSFLDTGDMEFLSAGYEDNMQMFLIQNSVILSQEKPMLSSSTPKELQTPTSSKSNKKSVPGF